MNKLYNFLNRKFKKENTPIHVHSPYIHVDTKFYLKLDNLNVGVLSYDTNSKIWYFEYTDDFKSEAEYYNHILEFPDIYEKYESDELWTFFIVRIPGLKQPKVKEILEKENIDPKDSVSLLQRFGKKTISNPYELFPI